MNTKKRKIKDFMKRYKCFFLSFETNVCERRNVEK